jgi:hypothetical protein
VGWCGFGAKVRIGVRTVVGIGVAVGACLVLEFGVRVRVRIGLRTGVGDKVGVGAGVVL